MTYEYVRGMGLTQEELALAVATQPAVMNYPPGYYSPQFLQQEGSPVAPPAPVPPTPWRGNFAECTSTGGVVDWTGGVRGGVCFRSGVTRVPQAPADNTKPVVRVAREYETCCYPTTVAQQKQEQYRAQLTAYQASMEVYRNSPEYKDYEQKMQAWQEQQRYAQELQLRARALALNPATSKVGDACSPPDGGFVGRLLFPVPRTAVERAEQALKAATLREQGCQSSERLFDMENVEVCCPPGSSFLPSAPPAPVPIPTPISQEKKYLGLTVPQLVLAGAASFVLYIAFKR